MFFVPGCSTRQHDAYINCKIMGQFSKGNLAYSACVSMDYKNAWNSRANQKASVVCAIPLRSLKFHTRVSITPQKHTKRFLFLTQYVIIVRPSGETRMI